MPKARDRSLDQLPRPERQAIELKYAGNSYKEISEAIDVPKKTVGKWFQQGGKLRAHYDTYCKKMNRSRDYYSLAEYVESDENIAKITTNVIRQFAENLQLNQQYVCVCDEDGKPITDENGNKTVKYINLDIDVKDFERVWKMQRVLTGRGTKGNQQDTLGHEEDIEKMVTEAKRWLTAKPEEDDDEDGGIEKGELPDDLKENE